jgi:hypothetical protein
MHSYAPYPKYVAKPRFFQVLCDGVSGMGTFLGVDNEWQEHFFCV